MIVFIENSGAVNSLAEIISVEAVGDGVTDDYPAFQAAHEALPAGGGWILIPNIGINKFRLSQAINLRKPVRLTGMVGHFQSDKGTVLYPDAGVSGIIINTAITLDYTTVAPSAYVGATGSVIENLSIHSAGGTAGPGTTVDGIFMRANAVIRNVTARGFKRNGIRIEADLGSGGATEGNANGWRTDTVKCIQNGADGMYVSGADANVGLATRTVCQDNGGFGLYENSLIGNTYNSIDCDSNSAGSISAASVSASNTFVGVEIEGTSLGVIGPSSLVIGGVGLHNFKGSTGFVMGAGGLISCNALAYENTGAATIVRSRLGARAVNATRTVFSFGSVDENSTADANQLKYDDASGWWSLENAGSSARTPIQFPNAVSAPRAIAPLFRNGHFFGGTPAALTATSTGLKFRGIATAAPTTGTYIVGDHIENSVPTVGQPKGWWRTVNGTEGTLNGGATTGDMTTGTPTLVVNSATGLTRGCFISVAGAIVKSEVLVIAGTTITLASNATATVTEAAVAFVAGTWVADGNL